MNRPQNNDTRIKCGFLFLPKTLARTFREWNWTDNTERRHLVFAKWVEIYYEAECSCGICNGRPAHWEAIHWLDTEGQVGDNNPYTQHQRVKPQGNQWVSS